MRRCRNEGLTPPSTLYYIGLTSKELDAERAKWPKETVQLWARLSKKEANGKYDLTLSRYA